SHASLKNTIRPVLSSTQTSDCVVSVRTFANSSPRGNSCALAVEPLVAGGLIGLSSVAGLDLSRSASPATMLWTLGACFPGRALLGRSESARGCGRVDPSRSVRLASACCGAKETVASGSTFQLVDRLGSRLHQADQVPLGIGELADLDVGPGHRLGAV